MQNSQDEQKKVDADLASCQLSYVVIFNLLSPLIGYSYTGRFKALGFFIGIMLAGFVGASQMLPKLDISSGKVKIGLGLGIAVIATIDNAQAILTARKRHVDLCKSAHIKAYSISQE